MTLPRRLLSLFLAGAAVVGFWLLFRPDPAPADGKIHVRYWEKWSGFEEDAMRKVVDTFNQRQSRIHVDMLSVSQANQKVLLATAGGNPPDVAGLWDYDVVAFADYNALTPLDELCRRDGISPDDYLPAYWRLCTHRGQVFALPTTPASLALHWNRTAFREAGLDPDRPPRTLEELDELSDRLTKRDASGKITQMGFMQAEPGWWHWAWGYYFGGTLWDGAGRVTITAPENLRGFSWAKSYSDKYDAKELQVFQSGFGNFSSPQNAFMTGQVAMVLQGVWMANFINNNNPSLQWDAAPFPYPANRPDLANSTAAEADVLVIPRGAKHPEAAWEFIKYVQSQEGMELLCAGQWKHSPLSKVSERFYREHKNKRIKLFYDLAASKNAFSWPRVGIWREWRDEMKTAFEKVWTAGQSPEEALAYSQDRMQAKLTQYDQSLGRQVARDARPGTVH
jgi:ABC-type glycerol-3-phosphate transport system substrate-binding protein